MATTSITTKRTGGYEMKRLKIIGIISALTGIILAIIGAITENIDLVIAAIIPAVICGLIVDLTTKQTK